MTMILSGNPKILENMLLMSQLERCIHILYTRFLLLYAYDFEWKSDNFRKYASHLATGNGVYKFFRSCYYMTMILSGNPKIFENMILISQRERCIDILYTPFLLLYDYDFEWKSENFRKYASHVATGTVYTHSVFTVPVTI